MLQSSLPSEVDDASSIVSDAPSSITEQASRAKVRMYKKKLEEKERQLAEKNEIIAGIEKRLFSFYKGNHDSSVLFWLFLIDWQCNMQCGYFKMVCNYSC